MSVQPPNLFDKIQSNVLSPAFQTFTEIQRLFPDSVLFGSLILYVLTLNKAFGVLALFMLETTLIHKLIAFTYEKTYGPTSSRSSENLGACYPGFRAVRKEIDRILHSNQYPSVSIYSMFSTASYLLSSMLAFKDTLDTMGQDWSSRFVFAMVFIGIVPFFTLLIRYFIGCESFGEIVLASMIGIFVGAILFVINRKIFGLEGVNFLGLPYLVNKSDEGSDIYVCAPRSSDESSQ